MAPSPLTSEPQANHSKTRQLHRSESTTHQALQHGQSQVYSSANFRKQRSYPQRRRSSSVTDIQLSRFENYSQCYNNHRTVFPSSLGELFGVALVLLCAILLGFSLAAFHFPRETEQTNSQSMSLIDTNWQVSDIWMGNSGKNVRLQFEKKRQDFAQSFSDQAHTAVIARSIDQATLMQMQLRGGLRDIHAEADNGEAAFAISLLASIEDDLRTLKWNLSQIKSSTAIAESVASLSDYARYGQHQFARTDVSIDRAGGREGFGLELRDMYQNLVQTLETNIDEHVNVLDRLRKLYHSIENLVAQAQQAYTRHFGTPWYNPDFIHPTRHCFWRLNPGYCDIYWLRKWAPQVRDVEYDITLYVEQLRQTSQYLYDVMASTQVDLMIVNWDLSDTVSSLGRTKWLLMQKLDINEPVLIDVSYANTDEVLETDAPIELQQSVTYRLLDSQTST